MGKNLYKIETCLRTAPIDSNAIESPREIARIYSEAGFDAIIVTNRLNAVVLSELSKRGNAIEKWLDSYRELKKFGERLNLKVWLGAEITVSFENASIDDTDYILYGIDEEFIKRHGDLLEYDLDKLLSVVHEVGGIVIRDCLGDKLARETLSDGILIDSGEYSLSLKDYVLSHGKSLVCGSGFLMRGDEVKGATCVSELKGYGDFVQAVKDGKVSFNKGI